MADRIDVRKQDLLEKVHALIDDRIKKEQREPAHVFTTHYYRDLHVDLWSGAPARETLHTRL